mgnify:CR=1 FL=1
MEERPTYTFTIDSEEETQKFLTKDQRKKLMDDILNSQQKLAFIRWNRKENPDREHRNFLMDREEDNIDKIKEILINNKF